MQTDCDVDVLIVGAGQMGLTSAATLLRYGVQSRIIELTTDFGKAVTPSTCGRAQELLVNIDARDRITRRAVDRRAVPLDMHRNLHDRFEIAGPGYYATRPDGHVGFRGGSAHVDLNPHRRTK